ncbi:hypothetical protein, partial [Candidatus Venteria ishoeyi]
NALRKLTSLDIDKMRDKNLHLVLNHHTYKHRFKYILDQIGFEYIDDFQTLTCITMLKKTESLDEVIRIYKKQNISQLKLLIILSASIADIDIAPLYTKYNKHNVNIISESYLLKYAKNINNIIKTTHFAFVDLTDKWSSNFLQDAFLHSSYIETDFILLDQGDKYKFSSDFIVRNLISPKSNFDIALRNYGKQLNYKAYSVYSHNQ